MSVCLPLFSDLVTRKKGGGDDDIDIIDFDIENPDWTKTSKRRPAARRRITLVHLSLGGKNIVIGGLFFEYFRRPLRQTTSFSTYPHSRQRSLLTSLLSSDHRLTAASAQTLNTTLTLPPEKEKIANADLVRVETRAPLISRTTSV